MDTNSLSGEIANVRPIRDIVYDYLRNAILDGQLMPGERIVERNFAEKFGASRTPIREAIRKLEMEGLLEYIPRKGVIIKDLSLPDIIEIYAIRKYLEALAFKTAIPNLLGPDLAALRDILNETERFAQQGDAQAVMQGLERFDEAVMNASKMPRLKEFIRTLQESIRRFRKLNLSNQDRRQKAIVEHKEILESIVNRDATQVERLVIDHIDHASQHLIQIYTNRKKTL